jgi:NitT/TauT family transport system permease protein
VLHKRFAPAVIAFIVVLAAWSLTVRCFRINPVILPPPIAVLQAFVTNWRSIATNTGITMAESILGFTLGSITAYFVAIAFVRWHTVRDGFYPYAIALKSTPLIAIAPLLTMWFGDGMLAKVVMAALVAYFPVLVGAVQGLTSLDPELLDLMRSYSASWWQVLVKLRVPRSMSHVFAALKTASSLAVVGALIGEFTGATRGIGSVINMASYYLQTATVFAGVLAISLAGIAFFGVVSLVQQKVLTWEPPL